MKYIIVALALIAASGCAKETTALVGPAGADGLNGAAGPQGPRGHDSITRVESFSNCTTGGKSYFVGTDVNDNSLLDPLEVAYGFEVCNGADAPQTALQIVDILDPCGDAPGILDEVFLKLADGRAIASVSDNANGNNTRFSVLTPGNYMTTDGDNCVFRYTAAGVIVDENKQH